MLPSSPLRTLMSDSRLYSRLLLPKGHGYPLFHPEPFDDLPVDSRRRGTEIGDVGVLTSDGSFDIIFNICRPAEDPLNRFGVPEGFEQIRLGAGDVAPREQFYRPGSDVSSTNVAKRRLDMAAGVDGNVQVSSLLAEVFSPLGVGAVVEVSTASSDAATGILLLPDGGSRADLRRLQRFRNYAIKHARHWYAFVNGELERMVDNGDLYLVTGVDKCTSWSVAALETHGSAHGFSLKLKALQAATANASYSWEWEVANSFTRSGPSRREGEESWTDNQTVFLRGFKVAVRASIFGKSSQALSIVKSKPGDILSSRSFGASLSGRSTRSSSSSSFGSISDERKCCKPYHPADAINAYLLESSPEAAASVIHDDEWASVLDENEDLPSDEELIERICEKYDIQSTSDGVYLQYDNSTELLGGEYELLPSPGPDTRTASIPELNATVEDQDPRPDPVPSAELPRLPALPDIPQDLRLRVFNPTDSTTLSKHEFERPVDDPAPDHENLVSLGDSVLKFIITDLILEMYPNLLARPSAELRSMLLCDETLAEIAEKYKLVDQISPPPSLAGQAEVLRAFVGAVNSSQSLSVVKKWLDALFAPYSTAAYQTLRQQYGVSPVEQKPSGPVSPSTPPASPTSGAENALARLNEYGQKNNCKHEWKCEEVKSGGSKQESSSSRAGTLKESGWYAEVLCEGEVLGQGEGSKKKAAYNEAARQALKRLGLA
ncbi:hypothetical protein GGX14DRAFT_448918 [Mycena pura]|uniref:Uncharacterized protein n=1 Tax=Mycena pura TaxID=153505 RepID=A0AAD6YG44_9AGAR|nr:hypothetical protein GGX14DRAFT_448918 [Mycena pura]